MADSHNKWKTPSITAVTLLNSHSNPSSLCFSLELKNVYLIATIEGEAPNVTLVPFVSQPKHSSIVFYDGAGRLALQLIAS